MSAHPFSIHCPWNPICFGEIWETEIFICSNGLFAGGACDFGKPVGYVSSNMLSTDPVTANVLMMSLWSA